MNTTLGEIGCPICGTVAELRRCRTGAKTWYWICRCGKITPNLAPGQEWIMNQAHLFAPGEKQVAVVDAVPDLVAGDVPAPVADPTVDEVAAARDAARRHGWFDWE